MKDYTLKMFMEDYQGFDWQNGEVVLVVDGNPHICHKAWKYLLKKHGESIVRKWTHDEKLMVIVVKRAEDSAGR